jgi:hypothetical protein
MDNEILKSRIEGFIDLIVRVVNRVTTTKKTLEAVITEHGKTKEILDLVKQFYQMKIHEFELLQIIFNDITNNEDFKKLENSQMKDAINNLKNQLEEFISQAQEDLADQLKIEQVAKKSVLKANAPLTTKALLKTLGLK